jgi:hypothetical protein
MQKEKKDGGAICDYEFEQLIKKKKASLLLNPDKVF